MRIRIHNNGVNNICLSGTDNIPARGGRGLGGYDYYTFTYDEEDGYEEDSLPGTWSTRTARPTSTLWNFSHGEEGSGS